MNLLAFKGSCRQVNKTIAKNTIRYVFPHRKRLQDFIESGKKQGFINTSNLDISELAVAVDIDAEGLNKELQHHAKRYRGVAIK